MSISPNKRLLKGKYEMRKLCTRYISIQLMLPLEDSSEGEVCRKSNLIHFSTFKESKGEKEIFYQRETILSRLAESAKKFRWLYDGDDKEPYE